MGFFRANSSNVDDSTVRKELFVPFRLVVSNGDRSHWMIDRKDDLFGDVWKEAKSYLTDIAQGDMARVRLDIDTEDWGDIVTLKGFAVEFGMEMKPDLLKWFLGCPPNTKSDMPPISKMMIVPDSDDEASSRVYLYGGGGDGGKGSIYEYKADNYVRTKSPGDILTAIAADNKNTYREYCTMKDAKFDKAIPNIGSDVLFVLSPPRSWPYYDVRSTIPAGTGKADELADVLLGSEKDRYEMNEYSDRIQFNNTNNIYKIYNDGYLSYKYVSDTGLPARGNIGDAIVNAYRFFSKVYRLTNMKAEIRLTGVDDSKPDYFRLTFDYRINGLPVFTELTKIGSQGVTVANAITIDANSVRVLKCGWVLRNFAQGPKKYYNDRLMDLVASYNKKITDMNIRDISVGYLIDDRNKDGNGKTLQPSMIIGKKDEPPVQAIEMPSDAN